MAGLILGFQYTYRCTRWLPYVYCVHLTPQLRTFPKQINTIHACGAIPTYKQHGHYVVQDVTSHVSLISRELYSSLLPGDWWNETPSCLCSCGCFWHFFKVHIILISSHIHCAPCCAKLEEVVRESILMPMRYVSALTCPIVDRAFNLPGVQRVCRVLSENVLSCCAHIKKNIIS